MSSLEGIVLSPTFTVALALLGSYLFLILTREFFLWFLKINQLDHQIKQMNLKIEELNHNLKVTPRQVEGLRPPPPEKEQFPLSH